MSQHVPVPEGVSQLRATQVAERCVRETKTDQMSPHAKSMALIGLASCDADGKPSRKAMRAAYIEEHRPGFVFTMIVLPLLISLVSQWIIRWWFGNREQAASICTEACGELSPRCRSSVLTATRTST